MKNLLLTIALILFFSVPTFPATNMEDFMPSGTAQSISILHGVNQASLLNAAYISSDDVTANDKSTFYAKYYKYLKVSLNTLNQLQGYVKDKKDFPSVSLIEWDESVCCDSEYILNYMKLLADADNYLSSDWFEYLILERDLQSFQRGPGCQGEYFFRNRLSKLYKFIYHYPDFPLILDVKREIDNIEYDFNSEDSNTSW